MAQQHLLYGTNILASDLAPQLEAYERNQQGVNAWRNLFGNASLQNMAAQDTLKTDYAAAAAEAYKTYQKQKNDAFAARLAPGATADIAAQANRDFMNSAYSQYVSKYLEDANKLAENYGNTVTGISDSLTERAENYASLYRSAYDYLAKELAGAEKTVNNTTSRWLADNSFADFLTAEGDLRDWNDISKELFDEDRKLTAEGHRFYDAILNSNPSEYRTVDEKTGEEGQTRSFDEWLAATNPTLRDWYASADYVTGGKQSTNVKQGIGLKDRPYTSRDYTDFSDYADSGIKEFDVSNRGSFGSMAINNIEGLLKDYLNFDYDKEYDEEVKRKAYDRFATKDTINETVKKKQRETLEEYHDTVKNYRDFLKDYYDGIVNQLTTASFEEFSAENASLIKNINDAINKPLTNTDKDLEDLKQLTEDFSALASKIKDYDRKYRKGSAIKATRTKEINDDLIHDILGDRSGGGGHSSSKRR